MVNDVSRAYMYADCDEELFVELCEEDIEGDHERHMCGKLVKAMYGTRPTALNWQREYCKTLETVGFV